MVKTMKKNKIFTKEYGIYSSETTIQTKEIQNMIDDVSSKGGGTIVFEHGIYLSGALFLKPNVDIYLPLFTVLEGSDDINDYPLLETRIEGETCLYYSALINIDGCTGNKIFGQGEINGNGLKSWQSFWKRREWNPNCTNKDEQRARLIYISNSSDVTLEGITFKDSQFWTCHLYNSKRIEIRNCSFLSPKEPIPSPSTDGIDIDKCNNVHISGCYFEVNDDAIALKGGKGIDAKNKVGNGPNENITIESCEFGFCHSCLTFGSETIRNKSIVFKDSKVNGAWSLLHFKMRTDTAQEDEDVHVENIKGNVSSFVQINSWSQFQNLQGNEMPFSRINNVSIVSCEIKCDVYFNSAYDLQRYSLSGFVLKDLKIEAKEDGFDISKFVDTTVENVNLNIVD